MAVIQKYRSKISGPLLDRIDLQVEVPRLKNEEITHFIEGDFSRSRPGQLASSLVSGSSSEIKKRVEKARAIQEKRYQKTGMLNGLLKGREIRKFIKLDQGSAEILKQASAKFFLSHRMLEKVIKVSRTIADLETSADIKTVHLTEALNYRLFKNYF